MSPASPILVTDGLAFGFRDLDPAILDTMEDLERWGHVGKNR